MRCTYRMLFLGILVALTGCRTVGFVIDPDEAGDGVGFADDEPTTYGSHLAYPHVVRADILMNQGEFAGAVVEWEAALKTDPWDFYLRSRLAEALIEVGELSQAHGYIRKVLRRDRNSEMGWLTLAKYYVAMGNKEEAERSARRAMRVEPSSYLGAMWLAEFYRKDGRLNLSAEVIGRVVLSHSKNAEARFALGEVLLTLGKTAEAKDHLTAFVGLRPFRADVIERIAELTLDAGDRWEAAELFMLVLDKDPSNEKSRRALAFLQIEMGLREEALRHIDTLPPVKTGDVEGGIERACLYFRAGEAYRARSLLVEMLVHQPDDPAVRLALADAELTLGRMESAIHLVDDEGSEWPAEARDEREALLNRVGAWPAISPSCGN